MEHLNGRIVDLEYRRIFPGRLTIDNGRILEIEELAQAPASAPYLLPGFVDAHVHIESSMLTPAEFARLAAVHGTVATVSDPHEIANVLGLVGVEYMLDNARQTPMSINFGAPSCVPATAFETAGAVLGPSEVEQLLARPDIRYLSEMMNYPGVLHGDAEVMAKIAAARRFDKPIDGHAPGLRGEEARRYAAAGISTDHECFTAAEALDKLSAGMKIIIREGSAARNFDALIDLLPQYADHLFFCSDDKHPDDLLRGHINDLVRRAVHAGYDVFDVLRAACRNPVQHYGLDVGQLRPGDLADFIVVEDLRDFRVLATYCRGQRIAADGQSLLAYQPPASLPNQFAIETMPLHAFQVHSTEPRVLAIRALDGELVTEAEWVDARVENGLTVADPERDLLKIVVVNRYQPAPPAVAFIRGFGLRQGAIASCVAHDSHNIIAVGADDKSMFMAVNSVIKMRGGIATAVGKRGHGVPLPIAGIMSDQDGQSVGRGYAQLDQIAREELGSPLRAPFMTLSFMALLVIPALKLSDRGLFDGREFRFVE